METPSRPLSPYAKYASDGHSLVGFQPRVLPLNILVYVHGREEPVRVNTSMQACDKCRVLMSPITDDNMITIVTVCRECGVQERTYKLPIE